MLQSIPQVTRNTDRIADCSIFLPIRDCRESLPRSQRDVGSIDIETRQFLCFYARDVGLSP